MFGKYQSLRAFLQDLADAVRAAKGSQEKQIVDTIPDTVRTLNNGRAPNIQPLTITKNGTFSVPSGVDGYNPVVANIQGEIPLLYAVKTIGEVTSGRADFLTNSDFVKAHQNDPGFFACVWPEVPSKKVGYSTFFYEANSPIGVSQSGTSFYGVTVATSAANQSFFRPQTGKLSGNPIGYNGALSTDGNGNLRSLTGVSNKCAAGKYFILMGVLPMGSAKMLRSGNAPRVIDGTAIFAKGERGWWKDELYESRLKNNTWTPEGFPDGWVRVERDTA